MTGLCLLLISEGEEAVMGYANGRARELDANGGAKQFRGTGWELVMHAGSWYHRKGLGCVTLQCA